MATNPLVPQGTLNRIRGAIIIPDQPQLNVTAPFLGKGGISLGFEGESVQFHPTMTGAVTAPEPYVMVSVTVNLLKSQPLANVYEAQRQTLSTIGDITIKPDASTLPNYLILNSAIESVRELAFNGEDAGYVVMLKGYYLTNNNLFNLI